MHRDHVGMMQPRDGPSFPVKAAAERGPGHGIVAGCDHHLDGYLPVQAEIPGAVNHTHAPAPDHRLDPVAVAQYPPGEEPLEAAGRFGWCVEGHALVRSHPPRMCGAPVCVKRAAAHSLSRG